MKTLSDADYKRIYEEKPYYNEWIKTESLGFRQILIEDLEWKLPCLHEVIPYDYSAKIVAEVGCSVGHIIGNIRINGEIDFERWGFDVNTSHIDFGRTLYPSVHFRDENIFDQGKRFDLLVLCDILEHLQDDIGFLKKCREISDCLLVNIPLEKCMMTRERELGPESVDGHLRRYDLSEAKQLLVQAGFTIMELNVISYLNTYISRKIFRMCNMQHPFQSVNYFTRWFLTHFPWVARQYSGGNLFAFCR